MALRKAAVSRGVDSGSQFKARLSSFVLFVTFCKIKAFEFAIRCGGIPLQTKVWDPTLHAASRRPATTNSDRLIALIFKNRPLNREKTGTSLPCLLK